MLSMGNHKCMREEYDLKGGIDMKKTFSRIPAKCLMALVMILCMVCAILPITAMADGTQFYPGGYNYTISGTVICRQLNVRSEPKTSAKSYGKLKNGQTVIIVGEYDDWTVVDLSSCGFNMQGTGYVKKGLIKPDPHWIVLTQYTNLYATPWQMTNPKNGEQSGRVMLVIEENYPFYAVQCCEETPGTSFIYMGDVGQYSQYGQNLYVVAEKNVPIYDAPWGRQISTLDRFTIVNVEAGGYGYSGIQEYPFENYEQYYESDGFYYVTVNYGQNDAFSGYVPIQYIQKIIN